VLPAFDLRFASSNAETLQHLDEDWFVIAGGTEMVPALRIGALSPAGLVDINRNSEMRVLAASGPFLEIGATITHREVIDSELVQQLVPVLSKTCFRVGNARVRSTGTIGGNISFAEPRSDLSTVLCALGASVVLIGPSGERTLTIPQFVLGAFETAIGDGEVLAKVQIPLPASDVQYWKYTFGERPVVGIAYEKKPEELFAVVGAATDVPTSNSLRFDQPDVMDQWVNELEIGSDLAGSADYKRHLIKGKLRELGVGK
jgi:aerobic carbon-monoxide dehydrogenase medium subunit